MSKKLLVSFLLLALPFAAQASADKYTFDKDHTHVFFYANHLGFSQMIGRIKEYDGYFTFDSESPQNSEVDVTLKLTSVDTDVPALNKELQGDKFFNTKKFATAHFKSTEVHATGKNTGDVTGDLTLLGVTKPVTLHVLYNKSGIHPYTNNYISGFTADATIHRSDFGMKAYVPDVGDNVLIHIEAEGVDPLKHPGNSKAPH